MIAVFFSIILSLLLLGVGNGRERVTGHMSIRACLCVCLWVGRCGVRLFAHFVMFALRFVGGFLSYKMWYIAPVFFAEGKSFDSNNGSESVRCGNVPVSKPALASMYDTIHDAHSYLLWTVRWCVQCKNHFMIIYDFMKMFFSVLALATSHRMYLFHVCGFIWLLLV